MSTILYISNIQSPSKDNRCGFFMYRIYEEFHINLWECSMFGYFYIFPINLKSNAKPLKCSMHKNTEYYHNISKLRNKKIKQDWSSGEPWFIKLNNI